MDKESAYQNAIAQALKTIQRFNGSANWDYDWQQNQPEMVFTLACIDSVAAILRKVADQDNDLTGQVRLVNLEAGRFKRKNEAFNKFSNS